MKTNKLKSERRRRHVPNLPLAFIKELLNCDDGSALVREHLSVSPQALMFGVITIFSGLEVGAKMDCFELMIPPEPTLDYLQEALQVLGLPEVAALVKTDLPAALANFLKVAPSINLDLMEQNAGAMQLLFAT